MASPTQLTKEQLKSQLVSMGVDLPPATAKKEEFAKRYQEHILKLQEEEAAAINNENEWELREPEDGNWEKHIEKLTDRELYQALISLGKNIGPVVDSTRALYKKQLLEMLNETLELGIQNGVNGNAENGVHADSSVVSEHLAKPHSDRPRGGTPKEKTPKSKVAITETNNDAEVEKDATKAIRSDKKSLATTGSSAAQKDPKRKLFEGSTEVRTEVRTPAQRKSHRREANDEQTENVFSASRKRKYAEVLHNAPATTNDIDESDVQQVQQINRPGAAKRLLLGIGSTVVAVGAAVAGYAFYMGNSVLSGDALIDSEIDQILNS